jgi:hypothetical protein
MSKAPDKVELIEHGRVAYVLTKSHPESLNGKKGYSGRASSARIYGPAGSIVAFFDDQQFRTGENAVLIEKRVDKRIEVPLAKDFVNADKEIGDGVFMGEEPEYRWCLFKTVKKDWFRKNIPIDWKEAHRLAEQEGAPAQIVGQAVRFLGFGKSTSDNYRVDNTSSVRFGE